MSLIKLNDDRVFMGFVTFISLDESIAPKETDYGTDGKNKEWSSEVKDHHHTFFSHKPNHHVMVTMNHTNGEIGFGVHRGKFSTDVKKHYDLKRQNSDDAMTVMNKVMYVSLEGAKKHNINHLIIRGADEKLKDVYNGFVRHKFLQKHLKTAGYSYSHSDQEGHHFNKI